MRLSPPGTDFTAESTEVMRIKCLVQGHNMLMPGFEPSTSVSRNRHSNHIDQYASCYSGSYSGGESLLDRELNEIIVWEQVVCTALTVMWVMVMMMCYFSSCSVLLSFHLLASPGKNLEQSRGIVM